jgi:hypothetical protein
VIANRKSNAVAQNFPPEGAAVPRLHSRSRNGIHTAPQANRLRRISVNMSVPTHVADAAWTHLLNAIEQFEKTAGVSIRDLDIRSAPSRLSH